MTDAQVTLFAGFLIIGWGANMCVTKTREVSDLGTECIMVHR